MSRGCVLFSRRPGMSIYYAQRLRLSFSRALWQELRAEGVIVTALWSWRDENRVPVRAGSARKRG